MSDSKKIPSKAKSLVELSSSTKGELSVTDRFSTEDGQIVHDSCKTDIEFMVQYQGYWFAVHVDQLGTYSKLRIHGSMGRLPYSYESAFSRTNVMAVVRAAGKALGGTVRVDENQRIILIETLTFPGRLSPKVVIAETAKVLLRVKPYLQLVSTLQPPRQVSVPAPKHYKEQHLAETPPQPETNGEEEQQPATAPKPTKAVFKTKQVKLKAKPVITLRPNK